MSRVDLLNAPRANDFPVEFLHDQKIRKGTLTESSMVLTSCTSSTREEYILDGVALTVADIQGLWAVLFVYATVRKRGSCSNATSVLDV